VGCGGVECIFYVCVCCWGIIVRLIYEGFEFLNWMLRGAVSEFEYGMRVFWERQV